MTSFWKSTKDFPRPAAGCSQLLRDLVEPGEQRVAVLLADDVRRREHPRVRPRLGDVLGPKTPIEADRGVQLLEGGILGLAEA